MPVYLSIIAALVLLLSPGEAREIPPGAGWRLIGMAISLWIPVGIGVLAVRWMRERVTAARWFLWVMELTMFGVFAVHIYAGGLGWILLDVFSWLPLPSLRLLIGFAFYFLPLLVLRLEAVALARKSVSRRSVFATQAKWALMPMTPLFVFLMLSDLLRFAPTTAQRFVAENSAPSYFFLFGTLAAAYAYAPVFLRWVWRTEPLEDREMTLRLREIAAAHRLDFRRVSVWYTGRAQVANAAVAGMFPRSREIFVTDWLLKNLDRDEIEGVLAHELGHIRHRHLWVYLAFSIGYFLTYGLVFAGTERWLSIATGGSSLASAGLVIAFFYCYFVLLLGVLSRRLELQADRFALENIRNPEAFPKALEKLRDLNATAPPLWRFSQWTKRHPSVAVRIERAQGIIASRV